MTQYPDIFRTIADMRQQLAQWRGQGLRIGLVPTMGALHEGHLSLVNALVPKVDKVIVSIFINPTQFAPHEDFDTYPRTETADIEQLATVKTDAIFIPTANAIYTPDAATSLSVSGVAQGLESDTRPHFFSGVALIVTKLLVICRPHYAIFGEKDYQQLCVIQRLVADLNLDVGILGAPTLREDDGLAMSSRNVYLDKTQRQIAGQLNKIMQNLCQAKQKGTRLAELEKTGAEQLLAAGFDAVDYLTFRHAQSLAPIKDTAQADTPTRLLAAVRIGTIRLLDNMPA